MRTCRHMPLAAVLSLALTACGGGDGGSGGTQSASIATPTTSTGSESVALPTTPTPTPTPSASETTSGTTTPTPGATRYPPIARAQAKVGVSLPIGRCMNVEYDDKWRRAVSDADYTWFRKSGFDTIRLPVRFSANTATTAPYTINAAYLKAIRHVTDVATAAGLNIIIDLHAYTELWADPVGEKPRLFAIWRQIAEAFKDTGTNVYFELLNEPQPPYTNAQLTALYNELIPVIRQTNPTRPVIVSGLYSKGTLETTFTMPNDPYVMPTFHTYEPTTFTFQGFTYITPMVPVGASFGSAADYQALSAQLDRVKAFMNRTGTVPLVGEFGAYEEIPVDQRVAYTDAASNSFASIGLSSCVWAYSSGFAIRDDNGWLPGMIAALAKPLDK